jgi:serine/threonine-protein kinase
VEQAEQLGVPRQRMVLGRYEVLRRLGAGGFATVYLARDLHGQRTVVLKRLQLNGASGSLEAALRELEVARRVSHPHIVAIHDVVALDDGALIVMDHAEGGSLRELLQNRGKLAPQEVARILREVLGALVALHGAGLVHGDLKPENVLLSGDGAVRVADFGIAHDAHPGTQTLADARAGAASGTPAYMDPEQLRGEPGGSASDLYAAGVLARELLTGRAPSHAATERDSELPHAWRAFLRRALAPRAERFASAGAMAAALPRERPSSNLRSPPLRARSP